jgi:DNA-binding IclR family transcriptional regulator
MDQRNPTAPKGLRVRSRSTKTVAGDRQRGIDRVIALLDALLREHRPTKIGDIAKLIGAPRSTTYEIVARLVEADILEPCGANGQVYFGRAAHLFGRAYADANPLFRRVGELMERLAAETHATTQFCGLKGNKYVVIDSRDGGGLFRITTDIGVEVPIPWTASGRLLLDHMSPEEIRAFVPPEDFQLPDGRTLPVETFLADVAQARADGRCATTGLADPFTYCLAAPIRDGTSIARTTLCFVIPADTSETRRNELLTRLAAEAELLSEH